MDGGGHERGLRSGTLNVPGIVGFGKACEICMREMKKDAEKINSLRNRLEGTLLSVEGASVNGSKQYRLPHVTNMSFKYAESEALMMTLSKDIAVSSGSACMSASLEPSYVLKALGLKDNMARGSLRFSLGRSTTKEEIDYAIEKITEAVNQLRQINTHFEQ